MLVRTKEQKELYSTFLWLIKYIPVISVLLLTIHAICCLLGFNEPLLDNLAGGGILRAILLIVASYAFGLCWLHRICVYFDLIVKTLITIHIEYGLGILLTPCEILTSIAGIVIITLLVEHWKGFLKCNGNAKENYKWALEANRQ